MKLSRIGFEWKPEDLWIGAFWRWSSKRDVLDVWVCFVPCVPLHATLVREAAR